MSSIKSISSAEARFMASDMFARGDLVVIPTETVYGLAADATNGEAVARIYEAKGRPSFNPLIAHCADINMARRYGHFHEIAEKLGDHFWPGPMTIVVPYREGSGISDLTRAGLNTLAIRVPKGPICEIIAAFDKPIAAPSANLSGRVSATTAQHVEAQLGDHVHLILDDGPSTIGLESTIISVVDDTPRLLRPGGIPVEEIEELLRSPIARSDHSDVISAPGMLASHYAPTGSVRLNAEQIQNEDGALNFGASGLDAAVTLNLSETANLVEAAANLFQHLAAFDAAGVEHIAVAPVPSEGLGLAINDRLMRAAAPRG